MVVSSPQASNRTVCGGPVYSCPFARSHLVQRRGQDCSRARLCQMSLSPSLPQSALRLSHGHRSRRIAVAPCAFAGNDELAAYISQGPLKDLTGLTSESITKNIDQWQDYGTFVATNLKFGALDQLNDAQRERIFHLYLPVFFWLKSQVERHRSRQSNPTPLMLGMSAPQGCGKTTLVEQLEALFEYAGKKAVVMSIDDCYLTRADQEALSKEFPENDLYKVRGNAGTHDLDLGKKTLQALQVAGSESSEVQIPRYNKAAHMGKGDRADQSKWPIVKGPIDVVIFEGWMLGFRELPSHDAYKASMDLAEVNQRLRQYLNAWDTFMDAWLVLKVADPQWVYGWREQAEQSRRAEGSGMDEQEVRGFVSKYMPAYLAYLPALYARGPTTAQPGKLLVVSVDKDRGLAKNQPAKVK